eukprot:6399565-Alexandrium_andersonii.AAC.1
MSASLVGSEMCIRDRKIICPRMIKCMVRGRPQKQALRAEWAHWVSPRVEPVSYTHLTLPTICSV